MKKIFLITNSLLLGGAEKQSVILTHSLGEYYSTFLIVYFGDSFDEDLKALAKNHSIKIIFLSGGHLSKMIDLYKLFRKEKPFAIISFLLTGNLINGVLGKICKVPIRIGGIRSDNFSGWKLKIQKTVHQFLLSHTVFNNHAGYIRCLVKGFKRHKSYVIPNGIEIPIIENELKMQSNKEFKVLTVGRFVPEKDYLTFLMVVKSLKTKFESEGLSKKISVTIAGYGSLEKFLRQTIDEFGLNQNVKLLIRPKDVSFLYRNADVYLSTSIQEGVSNSILEAMSFGLPVVATNVGDNEIIIKHGISGFITIKKDIEGLSKYLMSLAKNPDLSSKMGNKGYSLVEQNYSINRMSIQFRDLIGL